MTRAVVTLLTDYGLRDEFAGVMRGVIYGICPDCRVIDITHGVEPQDVRQGAVMLQNALGYMPTGVHVAVVDPGVGTGRRALCVRCADGRVLVGPDNGLLSLAWQGCGEAVEAVDVSSSACRIANTARTFDGRDLFAPVAAHAARGAALHSLGRPTDCDTLVRLELDAPHVEPDTLVCETLYVDRFGNAVLNARAEHAQAAGLMVGGAVEISLAGHGHNAVFGRTFADAAAGEIVVYEDSNRWLAVAVNAGEARTRIGIGAGTEVTIRRR